MQRSVMSRDKGAINYKDLLLIITAIFGAIGVIIAFMEFYRGYLLGKGSQLETTYYGKVTLDNFKTFSISNLSIAQFDIRNTGSKPIVRNDGDILDTLRINFHGKANVVEVRNERPKGELKICVERDTNVSDACVIDLEYMKPGASQGFAILTSNNQDSLPEIKGAIKNGKILPMKMYKEPSKARRSYAQWAFIFIYGIILIVFSLRLFRMSIVRRPSINIPRQPPPSSDLKLRSLEQRLIKLEVAIAEKMTTPLTEAPQRERDAVKAFNEGVDLYKADKIKEADEKWREAIRLKPDYIEAHVNLGIASAGKGLLDEAIKEFQWVVDKQPNAPGAHYNLGLSFKYKRLYLKATEEFRKAINLNINYLEAYLELGETLHLMGNIPQSRFILIDALGHVTEEARRVRIIEMLQKTDADVMVSPLMLAPCQIMTGIMKSLPVKLTGFERTQASFIILSTSGKLGVGREVEKGKPKPIDVQFQALEANICRKIATLMDNLGQRVDGRVYWERQLAVEQDQVEKEKILKRLAEPD